MAAHFYSALMTRKSDPWLEELARTPELAAYVATQRLLEGIRRPDAVTKHYVQRIIYPLSLAFWLSERASHPALARPARSAAYQLR
jgi:hypothetical protein